MKFANENQKLVVVSGKGGVGKSVVSAAIAQKYAKSGQRTLLVELGEKSYFENVYNVSVSHRPVEVYSNLHVAMWSGETCLREYVAHLLKFDRLAELFFENRVMSAFINAAPALKELAILGKLTSGIRQWGPELPFDRIVMDAYSTGHMLALLRAPIGMAELVDVGPMGEQCRSIMGVLRNSSLCRFVIVTLLEELPVTEALELRLQIEKILGFEAEIICNRYYQPKMNMDQIDKILTEEPDVGAREFASYLKKILSEQKKWFEKVESNTGAIDVKGKEVCRLPLVFSPKLKIVIDKIEGALK